MKAADRLLVPGRAVLARLRPVALESGLSQPQQTTGRTEQAAAVSHFLARHGSQDRGMRRRLSGALAARTGGSGGWDCIVVGRLSVTPLSGPGRIRGDWDGG